MDFSGSPMKSPQINVATEADAAFEDLWLRGEAGHVSRLVDDYFGEQTYLGEFQRPQQSEENYHHKFQIIVNHYDVPRCSKNYGNMEYSSESFNRILWDPMGYDDSHVN